MSLKSAYVFMLMSTLNLSRTLTSSHCSDAQSENRQCCEFDSDAWPRNCSYGGDYEVCMFSGSLSDMKINVAFNRRDQTALSSAEGKNSIEIWRLNLKPGENCTCDCECSTQCLKDEMVSGPELFVRHYTNNGQYMSFPRVDQEAACYVVVVQHLNLSSYCIYVPEEDYSSTSINYTSTPTPLSVGISNVEIIYISLLAFLTIFIISASILCAFCRRKKGDPPPDAPLPPSPSPSNLKRPPSTRTFLFMYKYECELSERLAKELKSILKGLSDWCVTIHDPLSESRQQFLDDNLVLSHYIEESYCIFLISSPPVMDLLDRGKLEQENLDVLERPLRLFVQYFENCQKVQGKTRVVGLEENCPAGLQTRHSSLRFFMLPTKLDSLLEDLSLPQDCCSIIKVRRRLDELAGKAKAKADQQAPRQL